MKKFLYRDIDCGGEIRHRMDLAANHILEMDVDAVFARHFKKRKPIPEVPGHFAGYGMLLDAVVKAVASGIREKKLADWKEKQIAELIRTQSMDGSISIFPGNVEFGTIMNRHISFRRSFRTTPFMATKRL